MTTLTRRPAPAGAPGKRSLLHRVLGPQPLGLLFGSPYLLFVLAVFAFPVVYSVWIAFHDFFFAAPGVQVERPFVGLDNFVTAFSSPQVIRSFGNIGIFLVINVPLTVVLSLLLAAALDKVVHLRTFLRVSFYVPYVTASVAVVGVWLFLFNGNGLVNSLLGPLAPNPSWLINEQLAMPIIALYVTWKQLGFYILLYLAALQNVPKELYESASTDGAGRIRQFWSVTVPSVRPATLLVLLVSTVTGANLFTEPYLLTGGGGPNGASASPVLLMYQLGIQQGQPDVASAIGVVLVLLVLVIAYLQNRFAGERNS
ncbi:sugar ABC transporter permease [Rathayibacter sp. AY1E9]|uniref:carbohydrate ABC transporter permease n=1 Tax=unclassified Rathayibacter TaxID=2609250 RepID=UPI000CE7ACC2|nr:MULTISPECIES: sugar ABC transporter permease [unclassified Rathayibacter]PPG62392.1 sugar ABC transporter permease [Rathayibacter sp. AY1C7]PPH12906.1 sugar ABC transporter permease [Rathayibacter sp. AY1C1]PPH55169.1 sugar ABC transporter permease [Rathayibacter sp. AY1E1]PPF11592.1 sugar ABC transporter permease [Rathayibacter sp. AY1A5]PPF18476.1 sugar ABC transporter permease [Rathayibacter sp. AY1A4]